MSPEEALSLLGMETWDAEEAIEREEAIVFDTNAHFLRQPLIPLLITSRLKKLHELEKALALLSGKTANPSFSAAIDLPTSTEALASWALEHPSWDSFLRIYDQELARVRLGLSQALNAVSAQEALYEALNVQLVYDAVWLSAFGSAFPEHQKIVPLTDLQVRQTQQADTLVLRRCWLELQEENGFDGQVGHTAFWLESLLQSPVTLPEALRPLFSEAFRIHKIWKK